MERLRIKGHKLIRSRYGVSGSYAEGRCECGQWALRMRTVGITRLD